MTIAATTELAQEPRAPKLTPYIPMSIPGVSKEGYFVQKRFTILVKASIKKQNITEVLLAEGTKIRYKVTKQLIFCASDILSVLSYEMARAPFGIALSYRELADRMGRYCEKFVMVACRLLVMLGLLDPPKQLSGRNRSLTWKLPGRQKLIDALVVAATESETEACRGPHDESELTSGSGVPHSVRATDDTTCSGLAQDVPTNKDDPARGAGSSQPGARASTSTRHTMPDGNAHAASIQHICSANTAYMLRPDGIYAACNYNNYDSKDSAKLEESNYEYLPQHVFSLVWDVDAITWLISDLCPLDRPFLEHEPKVVRGQAALILAQTEVWGLSLEEAFKRVTRTLKYTFQEDPWFSAKRHTIPFCIGTRFSSLYNAMVKHKWTPPDEEERVIEEFRQGARRNSLFRYAGRLGIDLSQQTEQYLDAMALALEAAIQAEYQFAIDDPAYQPSDVPYLRVFAEFHCAPRHNEASGEHTPPAPATDGEALLNFQQRQADLARQFCWIGEQLDYPKMKVWNNQGSPYEWVESGKLAWQDFVGNICPQTILRLIVRHLCQFHGLRPEEAEMKQAAPDRAPSASPLPPAPASSFSGVQEAEPQTENLDEPPGMTCEEAELVIAQMQRDKLDHAITYRTSANGGVVLAIRFSRNPNEESEWLEVYHPDQWPGVWEARMKQTWARFEALRQSLPVAPPSRRKTALWQRRQ